MALHVDNIVRIYRNTGELMASNPLFACGYNSCPYNVKKQSLFVSVFVFGTLEGDGDEFEAEYPKGLRTCKKTKTPLIRYASMIR